MLFLLKKILPQLFIGVILKDKKNVLKACIYRGDKLIRSHEKTFDKSENLLEYIKNLSKHFLFYHTALFLNVKEQGLIPSTDIKDIKHFNIGKMSLQHILFNNALIYAATEHIEYYKEFFEDYKGLDFLYSPFALLYYNIQKEKQPDDKISLYAFKQEYLLTIIVVKGSFILYGDFKIFDQDLDLDLEFSEDKQKNESNYDDVETTLSNQLDSLEQENNFDTSNNLEELNQFSNDMEFCRYIVNSIEKFYNDDKYSKAFIHDILLYTETDINLSAINFLENETFLEIKTKQINTLDLMIELMRKELK